MYSKVKRILDFCCALVAVVLFSPLMAVCAVAIKLDDGSPVLFRQTRPGKDGKLFRLYKFRTMSVNTKDENGEELSDMQRMTKIGRILRKTSLDELPQFVNVLRGEMSFIGPRPLLCEYLELYSPDQARRHEVRPGISGLAQVNGRNAITWEEKFDFDVEYVDNLSLMLDIRILFKTVSNVLMGDGVNSDEQNTMEKFKGTKVN